MKKIILASISFVVLSISFPATAKYYTAYYGAGVKITKVHTHDAGGITLHIAVTSEVINLDECPTTTRVHLKGDLPGHKNMVSAALMAFAAGKNVGFHLSGCEHIPFWGAGGGLTPVVNNLWVH